MQYKVLTTIYKNETLGIIGSEILYKDVTNGTATYTLSFNPTITNSGSQKILTLEFEVADNVETQETTTEKITEVPPTTEVIVCIGLLAILSKKAKQNKSLVCYPIR